MKKDVAGLAEASSKAPKLLPLAAMMMATSVSSIAQQAASQGGVTLPEVSVTSEVAAERDGYMSTKTRVGKTVQDPHDVPQAVTSVTRKLMEEQQVGSLREALRNVSGLTFNAAEGGRSGDNMMLRGFYTFGDMYLDGIRDTAQYNRETFNLEQVDVLRGAGAMLFGRGQAGGVINMVSKTPLRYDSNKVTASVGTDKYREVTADFNKRINDATALRVNLMNRDEGSWRSNPANGETPELHRRGVAVSLALNQDTGNKFWINHQYLQTRDIPDYGVSFDSGTRRPTSLYSPSTYFGANKNFDNSDTTITTFVNELTLSPTSQLRTQLRMGDYKRSFWAKQPSATSGPDAVAANGANQNRGMHYKTTTLQSDYSNKFEVAGMKHEFLGGVEYLHESNARYSLLNLGGTSVANPPNYQPYLMGGTLNSFLSDSYAVYVQDTVEFVPKWKATVGVRRDQMDAEYSSTTQTRLKFGENSTRTALSYHPEDDTHYYLSHSDSFSPTADLYQLTTTPQPAERSQVIELGAKWLFMEGDLAFRAALYRANKDWERSTDLESTASILTKKRRTDGIEFELAGRITDNWEVFSGLAFMHAQILETAENINATTGVMTKGDERLVGKAPRNTPKYTLNLWSTYKLGGGWKVGGGLEAKGERYAYQPSQATSTAFVNGEFKPNTAPGYVRYDVMAAYEQAKWAVRLNIRNLFDKVYYDSVYDNGPFTVPGTRRAAILTTEFKF